MKADDQIRKVASMHKVPVDFDALWEQLEPHVPVKKKRRVVLWPFYSGALALVIAIAVGMYHKSEGTAVASSGDQTVQVASVATGSMEIEHKVTPTHPAKVQGVGSKGGMVPSAVAPDRSLDGAKSLVASVPGRAEARIQKDARADLDNAFLQPIAPSLQSESVPAVYPEDETTTMLTPIALATRDMTLQDLDLLPIPQLEDQPQSIENVSRHLAIPTILKAKRPKQFALMMTFGVGYGSMQLSGKSAESLVVARANAAESALENLTVGLALQQRLSPRWSLNYGLSYGRLVSKIEWQSAQVLSKDAVGVEKILIDPAGMVTAVPGVVNNKVYQIRTNRWYTYHHTLDLPLSLSYKFLQSGRHRFWADAGIVLQLYSSINGAYVSHRGLLEKFSAANNPYSPMGLGWTGGLTWERSCSRSYSVLVGLRGTTRTFYRSENLVQYHKNVQTLNLVAGIKKIF